MDEIRSTLAMANTGSPLAGPTAELQKHYNLEASRRTTSRFAMLIRDYRQPMPNWKPAATQAPANVGRGHAIRLALRGSHSLTGMFHGHRHAKCANRRGSLSNSHDCPNRGYAGISGRSPPQSSGWRIARPSVLAAKRYQTFFTYSRDIRRCRDGDQTGAACGSWRMYSNSRTILWRLVGLSDAIERDMRMSMTESVDLAVLQR